jgi:hypothetical protein
MECLFRWRDSRSLTSQEFRIDREQFLHDGATRGALFVVKSHHGTPECGGRTNALEPTMKTLTKAIPTIVCVWALGLSQAMAESCFETKLALINQTVSFAANDTNAAVQYKVCLSGERITSADILNTNSTLITLESSPDVNETGCAFVISNKSLSARLITYEGSTSKANATLNVCVLP